MDNSTNEICTTQPTFRSQTPANKRSEPEDVSSSPEFTVVKKYRAVTSADLPPSSSAADLPSDMSASSTPPPPKLDSDTTKNPVLLSPIQQTVSEIDDLRQAMEEVTTSQKNQLTNTLVQSLLPVLKPLVEQQMKQLSETLFLKISEIEKKISAWEEQVEHKILVHDREVSRLEQRTAALEDELDSSRQYAMKNHLIIDDIPENPKENADELVVNACKKLNITVHSSDVQRSHRLGPKVNDKPRPIIVDFVSIKTKRLIIRAVKDSMFSAISAARKQQRSTAGVRPKLKVREHLTKRRASFMRDLIAMKKDKLVQSVWTEDGVIIVRVKHGDRLHRINSEMDYNSFIQKCKSW